MNEAQIPMEEAQHVLTSLYGILLFCFSYNWKAISVFEYLLKTRKSRVIYVQLQEQSLHIFLRQYERVPLLLRH
jgi:hypothetical protein